jgi:transposase-like protein
MPRRPRGNHSPAFKSKVALAAVKGDKTISELSQQFDVHPNQITQWKTQLLDRMSTVFEGSGKTTLRRLISKHCTRRLAN